MAGARFYDPSIEWDMSGVTGWLEKRVYRGREVIPFLQAWADSWQDWHFDVDDVRDGEGERVSPRFTSGGSARAPAFTSISAATSRSPFTEAEPFGCRCS